MKRNLKFCIVALGVLGLTTSCTIQDVASQATEYLQNNVNLSSYSAATSLKFISTLKAESTTEAETAITEEESQDISDLLTQFDLILSNESNFNVVTTDSDRADYAKKEVISFTDVDGVEVSYVLYYSNIETTTQTTVTDTENDWDYFEGFGNGNHGNGGNGHEGQTDTGDDETDDEEVTGEGENHEGETTGGRGDHTGEGRDGETTGGRGDHTGEGRDGDTTGGRGDHTGEGQVEEFNIDDFDVNGDGEITVADIIAQFDTNDDGVLDYTDFTNFLTENDMEAPDYNEDGVADEADFIALFDFNEDGVVDEADVIAAFDVNGDGEFTEDDIIAAGPRGGRGGDDRRGDEEIDEPETDEPETDEPETDEPEEGDTEEGRAEGFRRVFKANEEVSGETTEVTSEDETPVEDETSEDETPVDEETSGDEVTSDTTVVEDSEEEVSVNLVTDTTTLTRIQGIALVGEEEYPFYSREYTEVNSDGSSALMNSFVAVLDQDNFIRVNNSIATDGTDVQSRFNYTYVEDSEVKYDYSVKAAITSDAAQLLLTYNGKVYVVEQVVEDEKTYILVTVLDSDSNSESTTKYEKVSTTDDEGNTTVSYVLVVEE